MKLRYIFMVFLLLVTSVLGVTVSGGVTEDIPISKGIAEDTQYAFPWRLDDSDLSDFMDTRILFQGKEYDIHDELFLRKDSPSIETSLTSFEDNYEDIVVMEVKKKAIYYMLMIDDNGLNISKATKNEPFEVDFLGKKIRIIDVPDEYDDDRFTAIVGNRYYIYVGNVININDKQITLVNVGAGGQVEVNVDGYQEMVPCNSVRLINGIEIYLDETFYDSDMYKRAAVMYIGNPAVKTYRNGDPYIGEDEAHPDWRWTIGNLGSEEVTEVSIDEENVISAIGPYIGIYNNFRATSDSDNPPGIGECYSLPNNYAEICLDSLNVLDTDYLPVTIEYVDDADLSDVGLSATEKVVHIHAPGDNRFTLDGDINTNEVWLTMIGEELGIFYRDIEQVPDIVHFGNLDILLTWKDILRVNYMDTMDNNIIFKALLKPKKIEESPGVFVSKDIVKIKLDINGDSSMELDDGADDLITNWQISSDEFPFGLGAIAKLSESDEILYGLPDPITGNHYELGVKDENHRTRYGVVIKDPKANGGVDRVVLEIPADQVQVNVVVKGKKEIIIPEPVEPFVVNILNPKEGGPLVISTNSIWLDVMTNRNAVCSYTLKKCNIVEQSEPEPEPEPVDCSVYEGMTCQEIIDYTNDILNRPYAYCECAEVLEMCTTDISALACPGPEPSPIFGVCLINPVPIEIPSKDGLFHSVLIENLIGSWSEDTKVENTLTVSCTDSSNNLAENFITFILDLTRQGIIEEDIYLNTGWNLFSIPLTLPLVELSEDNPEEKPIDIRINDIKDKVEVIYSYEQGQWKVWRPAPHVNTLTDLKAGRGYFIKLTEPAVLHVEGTISDGLTIPTFNVYEGWNLIGYYGTEDTPIYMALRNIWNKYSAIWTLFDNKDEQALQGSWKGLGGIKEEFYEELKRTHGYWLYMQEDGVIVPTN